MFSKYILTYFSVFIYLILIFGSCKEKAEVSLYGDLVGTVKNERTNKLVEDAVVSVTSGNETRSITTQSDGTFTFKKLDPGTLQLRVTNDKYEVYTQSVTVTAGESTPITVTFKEKQALFDISPATLDFVATEVSKIIYVKNKMGSGTIGFSAKANESWLGVNPVSGTVRDNQTVTLTVTVDRKGLAYGNYTGSIVFNADNNSIIYNITMQIPNPNAPSVTTYEPTNITQSSAEVLGNITNIGGSNVTQRGHCWSQNPNPTITDVHTSLGAGLVGQFSSSVTGLATGKTYYIRSYASNASGTGYSETKVFNTSIAPTAAAVSIGSVTEITNTSAKVTGNVTNIGGANVTEHGHVYSTSPSPTINDPKTTNGPTNAPQAISSALSSLKQGTKYYVRTYATNLVGTSYSNELIFETSVPVTAPAIVTGASTNVGQTSATVSATVRELGSIPIVQHGFCWSAKNAEPTIADSKNQLGSLGEARAFMASISLNKGTSYYVKPYLQTQDGKIYYGISIDVVTFEGGLALFYPFNTSFNDESGNNNNATSQNGAKLNIDRFGNQTRSLDFNSGYLRVNNPKIGTLANETSICLWVNISSANFSGNRKSLIAAGYSSSDSWDIYIAPTTNNKINFKIKDYEAPIFDQSSVVGNWHHLSMVKKGFAFNFYLDGVLVKSLNSPLDRTLYTADRFLIGNNEYTFGDAISGQFDDVRIYTYALSDSEVAEIAKR